MKRLSVVLPASRVPAENSGRILDIFLFLLLWYVVRYATDAVAHRVALAALPPGMVSLRFHLAYTTRSLAGLIFSIWYFKRFCHRRQVGFSERFGLDRPIDLFNPAFLRALLVFLFIFVVPNIARYMPYTSAPALRGDGANLTSYVLTGMRVTLLSPLAEELIWRGFAYPIFKEAYGLRKGIVFTSLLFALPHLLNVWSYPAPWALFALAFLFCVGAALAIIFEKGANLKWCILSHALLNLLLLTLDITFKELVWS